MSELQRASKPGAVSDAESDALPQTRSGADNVEVEVQWQTQAREHCPSEAEIRHWVRMAIDFDGRASKPFDSPANVQTELVASVSELTVRVVDRDEMCHANHQWRGKGKPTNVLSFPSDFPPETGLSHYGDVLICAEVLAAESVEQGKSVSAHWAHIVVHGTLHLLGYDHIDADDAAVMERREIEILATLGLDNPYLAAGESEFSQSEVSKS